MKTQDYLKYYREQEGYTQAQLAEHLMLTRQAISKWERGESYPDIENIILLSDLYDISLDELLRGSKFLKKPHVIGSLNCPRKFMLRFLFVLLLSKLLYFSNLPYHALSIFLTFTLINFLFLKEGGFIIERNCLKISQYKNFHQQIQSLLYNKHIKLKYDEIESLEIIYKLRSRMSPFDFGPDSIYFNLRTKDGRIFSQVIDAKSLTKLPIIVDFIKKKRITIIDPNDIIQMKLKGLNLYTEINS